MDSLQTTNPVLPSKLEDLSRFVVIGREKLVAVRAEIRAIEKLELAEEVRNQKREECTLLSEALLDAEVKLGELLKLLPKNRVGRPQKIIDTGVDNLPTKQQAIVELGIHPRQAERFETLANNKDLVEQVKAEARENDDIPTRSRVLELARKRNLDSRDEPINEDTSIQYFKRYADALTGLIKFEFDEECKRAIRENLDDDILVQTQLDWIRKSIDRLQVIQAFIIKEGRKRI